MKVMKSLKTSFLRGLACLAMLSLPPSPASAQDRFFRVMIARPESIFSTGFEPWGSNQNLLQHVQGTSCNRARPGPLDTDRSTYTSLSGTLEAALRVARAKLKILETNGAEDRTVWIYEVRPTPDVYNVARTFERAGVTLHNGPLRFPYQNALLLDEWVAPARVPPALIREGRRYQLVNEQVVEVPNAAVTNPQYQAATTQGNAAALPASVITGAAAGTSGRTRAVIGGLFSACWCDAPHQAQPRGATDPSTACTSQVQYLNEVVPSVRYFPVDGWRTEF